MGEGTPQIEQPGTFAPTIFQDAPTRSSSLTWDLELPAPRERDAVMATRLGNHVSLIRVLQGRSLGHT